MRTDRHSVAKLALRCTGAALVLLLPQPGLACTKGCRADSPSQATAPSLHKVVTWPRSADRIGAEAPAPVDRPANITLLVARGPAAQDYAANAPGSGAIASALVGQDVESDGYLVDFAQIVQRRFSPANVRDLSTGLSGRSPLSGAYTSSRFGLRRHPLLGGLRLHSGVDLAAPTGTPIRATSDGIVSKASWAGGYGLMVAMDNGSGVQTRFGHMSQIAVLPGQRVRTGDVIGFVGSTGRSTGPHLHYEVRINGRPVNPLEH